jgi:cation diffusion facilitator family transporter
VETASGCDGDHPEPKPHQHDQHDQNGHPVMAFAGHSLALLADAGHMLTDAGALGASLLAIRLARRPASGAWTFGFKRAEALSAQANGITLLVISAIVAFEAVSRLIRPLPVTGVMVVAVAALGVAVNVAATGVLANANRGSINVKGAFAHIVTDLYGFIGTLAAGTVIIVTFEAQMGKTIADLKVAVNAFFEYWLLATPRSLRDEIPGFEPVSTREDAEAELEEIKVMVRQPAQRQGGNREDIEALSVTIPTPTPWSPTPTWPTQPPGGPVSTRSCRSGRLAAEGNDVSSTCRTSRSVLGAPTGRMVLGSRFQSNVEHTDISGRICAARLR